MAWAGLSAASRMSMSSSEGAVVSSSEGRPNGASTCTRRRTMMEAPRLPTPRLRQSRGSASALRHRIRQLRQLRLRLALPPLRHVAPRAPSWAPVSASSWAPVSRRRALARRLPAPTTAPTRVGHSLWVQAAHRSLRPSQLALPPARPSTAARGILPIRCRSGRAVPSPP